MRKWSEFHTSKLHTNELRELEIMSEFHKLERENKLDEQDERNKLHERTN